MTEYFCAEINGDAQACARLIQDLRNSNRELLVDPQGYLIVAESEWDNLDYLAQQYRCRLEARGHYQQAA